ncbi:MAG: tRNA adenosine(34) deaminase TadA [Candidatus Marinimicrobia bacterium]|jgi:tRNA(adenine34) deaminase|nr:tRNA adenosine(34) deaminase TadA [Candidatus Neomarinimicrobiota bacterium]MDD4962127.1 tRNA adenosine(34) deaminase TadA [Candidatus Neomarinimicrobiota bacterium]MDD5709571.1 tRNA adenosine(34) deaminase TadA [Candidatus Neomarinimicrobiota bacterium]MDX9777811.1 tRNA adenosine(34) deaminase TadA [bacterium]
MLNDLKNPFDHDHWMNEAFREAEKAYRKDEVPVGAVIVKDKRIIARGHNSVEQLKDPTAHAEMIAITAACDTLEEKRLEGCIIYVTLEPCPMCAGAMLQARLDTCVYGTADPKAGACDSLYHLCEDPRLNHRIRVISGVREAACRELLQSYFRKKREDQVIKP